MTRRRAAAHAALGAAALGGIALGHVAPGAAAPWPTRAPTVTVEGPSVADTLRDPAPTFVVRASGFTAADQPLSVGLQVARDPDFRTIVAETTVLGDSARIVLQHLLPQRSTLYWRGLARPSSMATVLSSVVGPGVTGSWVTLLFPNSPTGTSVETRRPRLVWTSVRLPPAFGPWRYDVAVTRADGGLAVLAQGLSDTTFAPDVDLEANTPYRWAVTASLAGGDTARAQSRATFVVVDPNAPLVTLLYQNFPNPFPSGASMTTCFWFDLRAAGVVSLRITDLRGFPVRTLVPSATVTAYLPAGRYGRGAATTESGCDTRFAWDGTAADGRTVPAGVYLAWLVANGERSMRKVVFRGR